MTRTEIAGLPVQGITMPSGQCMILHDDLMEAVAFDKRFTYDMEIVNVTAAMSSSAATVKCSMTLDGNRIQTVQSCVSTDLLRWKRAYDYGTPMAVASARAFDEAVLRLLKLRRVTTDMFIESNLWYAPGQIADLSTVEAIIFGGREEARPVEDIPAQEYLTMYDYAENCDYTDDQAEVVAYPATPEPTVVSSPSPIAHVDTPVDKEEILISNGDPWSADPQLESDRRDKEYPVDEAKENVSAETTDAQKEEPADEIIQGDPGCTVNPDEEIMLAGVIHGRPMRELLGTEELKDYFSYMDQYQVRWYKPEEQEQERVLRASVGMKVPEYAEENVNKEMKIDV